MQTFSDRKAATIRGKDMNTIRALINIGFEKEWKMAQARDHWLVRENVVWNIHFSYEAGNITTS
jgi:hypothetical protein